MRKPLVQFDKTLLYETNFSNWNKFYVQVHESILKQLKQI